MNHKELIKSELQKFDYNNSKLKLTFGVLVVVVLCAFLIVIATFTELHFTWQKLPVNEVLRIYIPQVPVILFVSALLGNRFGFLSVMLYVLAGLTVVPVFALGGGWRYIFQYNFGYILAYIPAVLVSGKILSQKIDFKNTFMAAFWGVVIIHFIGILYTIVVIIFRRNSFELFTELVEIQSGIKIIYDFVFSIIAILIAKPVKKILWLAMG